MMAENSVMPYMPKLEMEKVPPVNSCGFSFPALACPQQHLAHASSLQKPTRASNQCVVILAILGMLPLRSSSCLDSMGW